MAVAGLIPLFGLDPLSIAAAAAGATAPDIDLVLGQRLHRRFTHWWPAWTALATLAWWWRSDGLPWALLLPFSLGALLHLVGDFLTPMGLPIGINPMRRHGGLKLFSTGTFGETVFVLAWTAVFLTIWYLRFIV